MRGTANGAFPVFVSGAGVIAQRPPVVPARGFTLPELVLVIAIVSIISVFAASRLSGTFASTRGFYDGTAALIQYARKLAIAQRRAVFVQVAAGGVSLCYDAACAAGVSPPPVPPASANPAQVSFSATPPFSVTAPTGVSISAGTGTFQFNGLGVYLDSAGADPGANRTVTVTGDGSHSLTVHRDTGYVQR